MQTGPMSELIALHTKELIGELSRLSDYASLLQRWAKLLAQGAGAGNRLLIAGNGGSAALAQHLAAELVVPASETTDTISALPLHADTSSLTAIANDYSFSDVFSGQVRAHGRQGDVLLVLTTSGRSENLKRAIRQADSMGMQAWAMTGVRPNPVADLSSECLSIQSSSTFIIQEVQLVAAHMLSQLLFSRLRKDQDRD